MRCKNFMNWTKRLRTGAFLVRGAYGVLGQKGAAGYGEWNVEEVCRSEESQRPNRFSTPALKLTPRNLLVISISIKI